MIKTRRWILPFWKIATLLSLLILTAACATPIRPAFKVNESLPIGSIQGDSFVGERYPFKIKIPEGWQATTKYPEFLVEQGYGLEGLKSTPFFLFNPPHRPVCRLISLLLREQPVLTRELLRR